MNFRRNFQKKNFCFNFFFIPEFFSFFLFQIFFLFFYSRFFFSFRNESIFFEISAEISLNFTEAETIFFKLFEFMKTKKDNFVPAWKINIKNRKNKNERKNSIKKSENKQFESKLQLKMKFLKSIPIFRKKNFFCFKIIFSFFLSFRNTRFKNDLKKIKFAFRTPDMLAANCSTQNAPNPNQQRSVHHGREVLCPQSATESEPTREVPSRNALFAAQLRPEFHGFRRIESRLHHPIRLPEHPSMADQMGRHRECCSEMLSQLVSSFFKWEMNIKNKH